MSTCMGLCKGKGKDDLNGKAAHPEKAGLPDAADHP